MKSLAQITPIGGSGQIGSNLIHITGAGASFVIDCGLLFPYEDFFDINYLIPDFYQLDPIPTHLIISHGHEDHIGAIVEFVRAYPKIEIWLSPFCRELVVRKLGFAAESANIKVYQAPTTEIEVGDFVIRPLEVNHSIPETHGLFVYQKSQDYCFFYVSDFKIDPKAINERPFDLDLLRRWSQPFKRRLLAADSTNILSSQHKTTSESEVVHSLEHLIKAAPSRVFITLFSSNVHRINNIASICRKLGRKLMTVGRSVENYMNAGLATDHLEDVTDILRTPESYNIKSDQLVIITSGCQGEFRSGLKRISLGNDSNFKPGDRDTFIFSSKAIPGNEKKVSLMLNDLTSFGSKIILDSPECRVHASGHAGVDDLEMLYDAFNPTTFFPTHGETFFLERHQDHFSKLHQNCQVLRPLNFDHIDISSEQITIQKGEPLPPILIHGNHHPIEREAISERRKLACQGLICASVLFKRDSIKDIQVTLQGLPRSINVASVVEKIEELYSGKSSGASEDLRIGLRRFYGEFLGYKPQVIIQVFQN